MQSATQQRRSFIARLLAIVGIGTIERAAHGADLSNARYGQIGEQAAEDPMMALGYVSRIMPDHYIHGNPPMQLARDIVSHVGAIKNESERREVSLAGVSAAVQGATGALNTAQREDWAWHPAYQDALDLRRKFETAMRMLSERIPSGQQIMLYPCGCAAVGNLPDNDMLPLDCGSEGHERGASSLIRGLPPKPRPTIEELEAILAQDGNGPAVTVLLNGEVSA